MRTFLRVALCVAAVLPTGAQTLHVDPARGDDANTGTAAQPLATILRAAEIANAGDGGATTGLPCHISFLSSRTNDAMVEVLSPLLPVARAVGVPVLDFDKYQIARDSDAVNAQLVPLIAEWLNAAVE